MTGSGNHVSSCHVTRCSAANRRVEVHRHLFPVQVDGVLHNLRFVPGSPVGERGGV